MPRVTRAALRSMEQLDESDIAASTPLPHTPSKGRVPLGEVAGNKGAECEATNTFEQRAVPAKKGTGKGRKGNTAKKADKQTREKAEEVRVDVLEDENQSVHSSAAEEASQDLLKDGSQGKLHETLAFHCAVTNSCWSKGAVQVVIDNDRPQTPPSAAANTASRQLSPNPTKPYFDPVLQKSDEITTPESKEEKEDSFVAKIESRTPLKMTTIDMLPTGDDKKDDSFVEQIRTRTPGRRISRIEDSVEALDALEEEIEMVGELIPATADGLKSPVKAKKQAKPQSNTIDKKVSGSVRMRKSTGVQKKISTGRPSTAGGPTTSNPSAGTTNTKARPYTSLIQQKPEVTIQSPAPIRRVGQPRAQATLKKRISSVHKAPFQPHKSTKPPTRANFELPGDAFARKLKEQREERLKREEEEVSKPRVFKARPVRLSHAPEVKLTAAAKARLSMAKGEPVSVGGPSNGVAKSRSSTRPGAMANASPSKRLSTLAVAKCSTQPTANGSIQPTANDPTRLTRGPSLKTSTTTRAPSALGADRPGVTAEESAHQKLKGKEVFGRTKVEIMEREKAKKDKEDAARRARADAAERGRLASREWAEKQKARKLEAGKVNEEGKAVVA